MSDQEYFTVHCGLNVNIEPLDDPSGVPSEEDFEAEIPAPFIVANEFSQLESLGDYARLELKNSEFRHVIQLLETQNAKLNLLLTFMLAQQDDARYRYQTVSFGASQLAYLSESPLEPGQAARIKLFLEHPSAAVFCYAQVAECTAEDEGRYKITMKYIRLREVDQDLLIKAALHQQQKLLRQRSLNRNK